MGFKPIKIKVKDSAALADAFNADYYKKPYVPENRRYNCPNCGAPITGSRCEYCGTRFGQEMQSMKPAEERIEEIDARMDGRVGPMLGTEVLACAQLIKELKEMEETKK